MTWERWAVAVGAALALGASAAGAAEPRPLFAAADVLAVQIRGPVASVPRAGAPVPATLTLKGASGETHAITLSPRGITRRRRETCTFPPLRVEFTAKPAKESLFRGQKRLKLVTPCREQENFQRFILLEYAAYRLYKVMTPSSFNARLLQVEYVGPDGRAAAPRYGFFIEDIDDTAWRNEAREAQVGDRVGSSRLDREAAARFAVFQYMIGNLDWSMGRGPEGEGCCHNSRLIEAKPGGGPLTPVPYDFDFAGLVDAPYAVPPNGVELPNVRVRRYRGYCQHNAEALATMRALRSRRGEFQAALAAVPGLETFSRRKAAAYLDGFFDEIATDGGAERVLRACLG